jgi:6-phosphogluconolactonase (cycloisomerase 2 family)
MESMNRPAVFAQTNDAAANELVAFARGEGGHLQQTGRHATGGRGTGTPHLPSQGSVAVDAARGLLLVANAGSADVSLFAIDGEPALLARTASGGERPVSVAIHGDRAYVLNAASGTIAGLAFDATGIRAVPGAEAALPAGADPAQVAFTPDGAALVVTDRAANAIVVVALDERGLPRDTATFSSSGRTPYGFDFAGDVLVVTEAFGGEVGAAAASSYSVSGGGLVPVSRSVGNTRSEVCWAVTAADGRHVWVTNFGDGTISLYALGAGGSLELVDPVAATTVEGAKGVRDAARSADGRFFYALDADARRVFAYRVAGDARLEPIGTADGLPETVAGLAAL